MLRLCTGLSGGAGTCSLWAFLECQGAEFDQCWAPDAFDAVLLTDAHGQVAQRLSPSKFGMDAPFSRNAALIPDLDGDGFDDFALAARLATVCPARVQSGQSDPAPVPPSGCFRGGAVALVSSGTGALLRRIDGQEAGALFGAGLATLGDALAIGAPGSGQSPGEVFLYRVSGAGVELRAVISGTPGDELGADVAPGLGAETAALSFLVGAPGASSGAGELVLLDANRGIVQRAAGPVAGAHLSRGVVTVLPNGGVAVVGALPDAFQSRGALVFFTSDRNLPRVQRGAVPGARLGASLVLLNRGGERLVVAGAPGEGLVRTFGPRGRLLSTTTGFGSLFGFALSAPGDLNGDGLDDLVAGLASDAGGDDVWSVPIFEFAR